uniref:Transmembrane protein 38B n=1 Tax=Leptobrachium leishanense TaxID=445787 RepID=A0A8C5LN35_9ANUR
MGCQRPGQGALDVAKRSPMACWFSAMLYCFGGGILSSILLAEPPVSFLSNGTNILLASVVWYLVYYSSADLFYSFSCILPVRIIVSAMKEVTRTWKVLAGVTHADSHYKDAWLVMITIGWARAAGGGLISNFEQLVRGVWKPESNELLKMSFPVKVSLAGAVLFTLQKTQHLPISRNNLMLVYTLFLITIKVQMMLTRSSASPFQPIEAVVGRLLFGCQQAETGVKEKGPSTPDAKGKPSKQPEPSSAEKSESAKSKGAKKSE